MDKGLDITGHLLALHAVLHSRPQALAACADALRETAARGLGPSADRTAALAARFGASPDWSQAARTCDWLAARPEASLLVIGEPAYPPLLAALSDPPPVLFLRGRQSAVTLPQLALVGSRAATPGAMEHARQLARELCRAGFAITSGLARGIDGAAHRGALDASGCTLAVLGCGIDRIYPDQHRQLAADILQQGVLLSEFPLGARPLPHHFPRRNRLISGLAYGLVVVEAGLGSGSLLTARAALEQGREVFAVPGSVRNPQVWGCHALLRDGAVLVERAEDVLAGLPRYVIEGQLESAPPLRAAPGDPVAPLAGDPRRVLEALGFEPAGVSVLVHRTGLTIQTLSSILLTLELAGRVRALPGGTYERVH